MKWIDVTLSIYVFSNIPEFFGGKCKCVAHGGCLRKDKGPWTDPEIKSKLMVKFPCCPYMIPLICYLAILSSSVIFFLQEVFYKAQKLEDEPTDENIFKELSKSQVVTSLAPSSSTNAVYEFFFILQVGKVCWCFSHFYLQVTSDGRLGSNSIATTPKTENYIVSVPS